MQRSVIPPWRFRGRGPRAAAECSALITHEILVRGRNKERERRGRNKERERREKREREEEIKKERGDEAI